MTIPQHVLDEIKSRIDMRSLVSGDLGKPFGTNKNPMWFKSPFRIDRRPSLAVYTDHAYDYADTSQGRIDHIDYIQKRFTMTFREAVEYLKGLTGLSNSSTIEHQKPTDRQHEQPRKISQEQIDFYRKSLNIVMPYLESRAIPYSVAAENSIGGEVYKRQRLLQDHRLLEFECRRVAIPYIVGNTILSLEFRIDDLSVDEYLTANPDAIDLVRVDLSEIQQVSPEEISREECLTVMFGPRYYRPKNIHPHVFGLNAITTPKDNGKFTLRKLPWGIISEGAMDAASVHAVGFRAALGYKATSYIDIRNLMHRVRLKYVVMHNDPDKQRPDGTWFNPGRDHAYRLVEQLTGGMSDATVQIIRVPAGFKDLNDMAKAGQLKDFLASAPFRIYPDEGVEF